MFRLGFGWLSLNLHSVSFLRGPLPLHVVVKICLPACVHLSLARFILPAYLPTCIATLQSNIRVCLPGCLYVQDVDDIFLLDCFTEVYVWVGDGANDSEKKMASGK